MSISRTRLAGICYAVTFVAGAAALGMRGPFGTILNAVAAVAYVAVAWLFFLIFAPVSRSGSLAACAVGLSGCVASVAPLAGLRSPVHPLAIFGAYCVLIGWLILRSTFVPRVLGVLMAVGGLSWLTFAVPGLARALGPYNFAPGILAEGALTVWLIVTGRDAADPASTQS